MRMQLFQVNVPHPTSRPYIVPEYEVPIIKALWKTQLKPDYLGNRPQITVTPTGLFDPRAMHNEVARLTQYYTAAPDGVSTNAFRHIYPTDGDFERAYRDAMERSAEAEEDQKRKQDEAEGKKGGKAAGGK